MRRSAYSIVVATILAVGVTAGMGQAAADTLQSPNYKFDESVIGGGGLIQSGSANYQVSESFGEAGVGDSASANYQFEASNKTTPDPALTFVVNNGSANFGSFSPATTATSTSTFSVSNYTSWGYVVQIAGNAPTSSSGHSISSMGSTGSSTIGTEQFGINLVANTSPVSFGANPVQTIFGVGVAAPNYNTANQYRYVNGETIATAPKSSGVTTYTISYIVNVGSLTPGGQYSANQTLVCVGTF
jgi:hypothetical protein